MIYVDVSAAVHSRAGLGRYSASLAQAIATARPGEIGLFYNQGREAQLPEALSGLPRKTISLGYKPWRMIVLTTQLTGIGLNRLVPEATLFHSTEHLLFPIRNVPTVLTVHDLIYKLYPAFHKRLNYAYLNLAMPRYCRRASAIITVSEATKRDLVEHYGTDPAKIHVVYEAAADHFRPPSEVDVRRVRDSYGLPARFLLHLSTIEPRKNLDRLVDAVVLLRQRHEDLCLLLAGARGWLYEEFFNRIKREGLEEVVKPLGWVPDQDLPAVIGAATLAVQPSLYEGFGLPILEHMACGQVVAASDGSSHPEVGGQAAAYFKATDIEEMVAVIDRLLSDDQEYQNRRQQGLKQAAKFSWSRAAMETSAVYDQYLATK